MCFLHPVISNFILKRLEELNSTGQIPSRTEKLASRLEETWGRTRSDTRMTSTVSPRVTFPDTAMWEPDPRPLMVNHPPRITDSNIRMSLSEDSLHGPCPRDDSDLGWVQIQHKSLFWEEKIEGFSTLWGLNMETSVRIHESCNSQTHLEYADIFTPTRHILQTIRCTCKVDRVHGLPVVVDRTFSPLASSLSGYENRLLVGLNGPPG